MKIKVPATSANLGPGFDTLGMALQFYNHFEAHPDDILSVVLSPSTCVPVEGLSLTPSENLLAKAYCHYFQIRQSDLIPAKLVIEAHVPLSRGLGSSSTAIVAGLYLANAMHPKPLNKVDLVSMAVDMEGHPDNVVPALLGGVRCCLSDHRSFSMDWPEKWGMILVILPEPVSTHDARTIMPAHYSQQEAVATVRGIAAWIYAVEHQDESLFQYALASDTLHQPARSKLIPEFDILKQLLQKTSVLGTVISGSGSALAVFTPNPEVHQETLGLLKGSASRLSHCKIMNVRPDLEGAREIASH